MSDDIYEGLTVSRGSAYSQNQVRSYSHYNDPIDRSDGRLAGNSRRHGDAPIEVQIAVMDRIAITSQQKGLNARETGYVLSIVRFESGFNPDAAAGTTSAAGLGQFVKDTGQNYGINSGNIWDVDTQINALIDHYIYNRNYANNKGLGEEYIYALHHDGPRLINGGLGLSTSHVMPYVGRYENFVREVHGMECFPAYTLISTSQGQRQISELRVGDQVWAFDASEDKGRGGLVLKRIKRLYHNTTTEWVKLSWTPRKTSPICAQCDSMRPM